ncbi:MAG: AAA-like domain-containing protein [Elainella sp. Prado103]|jgi:hypothetical protein|nr:AAA-like domain-containing protein [Elainella sp. Prado103]
MTKRRSRSVQATPEGIERLEAERRKRGLTLEALARSANIAADTLKRLNRRERVDRSSVRDIVSVLELDPTDVVDPQEWNQWYETVAVVRDQPIADPPLLDIARQSGVDQVDGSAPRETDDWLTSSLDSPLNLNRSNPAVPASVGQASAVPASIGQVTDGSDAADRAPDFQFYVERSELEALCIQTLDAAGGLLRIKAPQQMGKTTLLTRLLWQADQQGYETVCLSFQLADRAVFADLNRFLQWFCAVVSCELNRRDQRVADPIDQTWKDIYSASYNATAYFQDSILHPLDRPLVLALDNTDLVFEHEEIATDFCKLLRNWHDLPRRSDRNSPIWQKLRLVIVHATEIYGALDINASPLAGVGVVVDLPELTIDQVTLLVQRFGLHWSQTEVEQLTHLVGGHPYLLQLGLEQMQRQSVNLSDFLLTAATESGVYSNHLRQQLSHLEQSPELVAVFRAVVMATEPIPVKPPQAFKLQSMGLVHLEGNQAKPRCLLYRQYFANAWPG